MNKLSVLQNLKKVNAKPYPHVIIENALDEALGSERPEKLREAMRYSLLAGGKRSLLLSRYFLLYVAYFNG